MKPTEPGTYWYKVNEKWYIVTLKWYASDSWSDHELVIDLYGNQQTVDEVDGKWGPEIIPPKD